VGLSLSGCAGWWDEVTSKDFTFHQLFERRPDPFTVLQQSSDGDQRARAYRALGDADQFGGPDRDRVLSLLAGGASQERPFLCRAAAIEALGRYQDPRAVPALTQAFYAAGSYPADLATRLQMQAVNALGQTRQPAAEEFLLVVARDRPKVEGSDQEKQLVLDLRVAATKALANYSDARAVETLQGVLKTERDVALRDSARQSLKAARGETTVVDFDALAAWVGFGRPREEDEIQLAGATAAPTPPAGRPPHPARVP
jgi:HEAT repeat protein